SPPDEAWLTGEFNHMPIMNGQTEDEAAFGLMVNELLNGRLTATQYTAVIKEYTAMINAVYPARAAHTLLAKYPLNHYVSPSLATIALLSDANACHARNLDLRISRWAPLYAYEFDDRSAPSYFPPVSFPSGAYHSADLQYLFSHYHGGPSGTAHVLHPRQRVLSGEMQRLWVTFARTGDPEGRSAMSPHWTRYSANHRVVLLEGIPTLSLLSDRDFVQRHKCEVWRSIAVR